MSPDGDICASLCYLRLQHPCLNSVQRKLQTCMHNNKKKVLR
ncbi:hypothetical protein J2X88_003605 [Pseudomonas extremaustralis]|nr:hypothetical protein [Pseudomonas extremaustralis]